jgi:hypothetical protein
MRITVTCPACQKNYSVPADFSGRRLKCKVCGQLFTAQAPETAAESPGPAADAPETIAGRTGREPYATAALVCGIVAMAWPACITGPLGAAAAIIFGIMGVRSRRRGSAIAGIALGCLALTWFGVETYFECRNRRALRELITTLQRPPTSRSGPGR